jgi:hypothetical protein
VKELETKQQKELLGTKRSNNKERQTDTDRQTQTDIKRDKQTGIGRDRQTDKQTVIKT